MTTTTYPNWFNMSARALFERHLLPLAGQPNLRFLQIGVFTGDASVWLLDNVLTDVSSRLTDVDTWEGSDEPEHREFDWRDVKATYLRRLTPYRKAGRSRRFVGTSREFFSAYAGEPFDFIYVDGDHTSDGVYQDACGAFRVLKCGGLLAFDDYLWKHHSRREEDSPQLGVDRFRRLAATSAETLDLGAQAWFRKAVAR